MILGYQNFCSFLKVCFRLVGPKIASACLVLTLGIQIKGKQRAKFRRKTEFENKCHQYDIQKFVCISKAGGKLWNGLTKGIKESKNINNFIKKYFKKNSTFQ